MKLKKKLFLLLSLETLIIPLTTWADITLSTGTAGIGALDTNFTCTDPNGTTFTPVGIPNNPAWITPIAGTNWIGPTNGNTTGLVGWYNCTYKFTLDSINCGPSIEGQNSSDNGLQIFLNSSKIFDSVSTINPGWEYTYRSSHPFSASSGFVVGSNTLQFNVINGCCPIGLDVNALIKTCPLAVTLSHFSATPTPEGVLLEWQASEKDNVGFDIWRANKPDNGECKEGVAYTGVTKLNAQLIPTVDSDGSGSHTYSHVDSQVSSGNSYCYLLVDFDSTGVATPHWELVTSANP